MANERNVRKTERGRGERDESRVKRDFGISVTAGEMTSHAATVNEKCGHFILRSSKQMKKRH